MLPTLRLSDVMLTNVVTIEPSESAQKAWHLMCQCNVHHLVVTRGSAIVGMLSARDLGGPRGSALRLDRTVGQLMFANVATATPRTTVRQAAHLMRGRSIGCLPVATDKTLVGILTTSNLLELIAPGLERPIRRFDKRRGRVLSS